MSTPKRRKSEQKPIPRFRSESEERRFWETHDTSEYVDWSEGEEVDFPKLRPSTTTISLRLPSPLLAELRVLANKRDVPYQSLLKVFLAERVAAEQVSQRSLPNKRMQRTASKGADRSRRGRKGGR